MSTGANRTAGGARGVDGGDSDRARGGVGDRARGGVGGDGGGPSGPAGSYDAGFPLKSDSARAARRCFAVSVGAGAGLSSARNAMRVDRSAWMGLLSPLATPTDAAVASGVMTAVGANRARCAVVTNVCVAPLSRMASPSGSLPFGWLKSEGVKRNVRRGSLGRLARAVYAAYAAAKYVAGTGLSSGSSPRKRQQL